MNDIYDIARGWEAGHDKAWEAKWGEGYPDHLSDEDIEEIEQRNEICRSCHYCSQVVLVGVLYFFSRWFECSGLEIFINSSTVQ